MFSSLRKIREAFGIIIHPRNGKNSPKIDDNDEDKNLAINQSNQLNQRDRDLRNLMPCSVIINIQMNSCPNIPIILM